MRRSMQPIRILAVFLVFSITGFLSYEAIEEF